MSFFMNLTEKDNQTEFLSGTERFQLVCVHCFLVRSLLFYPLCFATKVPSPLIIKKQSKTASLLNSYHGTLYIFYIFLLHEEFWTTTGYQDLKVRKPRVVLQKPWKRTLKIFPSSAIKKKSYLKMEAPHLWKIFDCKDSIVVNTQ